MRIVVKIGSNILAGAGDGLNERRIDSFADAIAGLKAEGIEVAVVSSGAIAAGMKRLGLKERPKEVRLKQAAAAAGQSALMWAYEKSFNPHKIKVAQVLLTRDDLSDRNKYLNAKNTLMTLLSYGVIPVINENDTVATDEIKFGDNDHLAALVAAILEADRLVILSDVEGLYSEDPRKNPDARLIEHVERIKEDMLKKAGGSGDLGTGGMYSKLLAADRATQSGITVNIINGRRPQLLQAILKGASHGTEFLPGKSRLSARKGWIAFGIRPKGSIVVDEGAKKALIAGGKSLLPSGITSVEGNFRAGDAVYLVDGAGVRFAKGLAIYSSEEVLKIMGKKTSEIEKILGYRYSDEVINRDDMVVHGKRD